MLTMLAASAIVPIERTSLDSEKVRAGWDTAANTTTPSGDRVIG
jgi:hypothetical protein